MKVTMKEGGAWLKHSMLVPCSVEEKIRKNGWNNTVIMDQLSFGI